jgi:hypothetical protein
LILATAAIAAALSLANPAGAQEVAPGGGNGFGQHVAGMAPEHATAHGALFGECVSSMATGGTCTHAGG